eukprot:jgi/Botrbrau1/12691/Bobra.67_1s0055.1
MVYVTHGYVTRGCSWFTLLTVYWLDLLRLLFETSAEALTLYVLALRRGEICWRSPASHSNGMKNSVPGLRDSGLVGG